MTWNFVTFPKIYLQIFSKKKFLIKLCSSSVLRHLWHSGEWQKNGLCKTLTFHYVRCVSIIYRFIQHNWWLIFLIILIITQSVKSFIAKSMQLLYVKIVYRMPKRKHDIVFVRFLYIKKRFYSYSASIYFPLASPQYIQTSI